MTHIHPTAVVSPNARIGDGVSIGPFCVIDDDTEIGSGSVLHARVSIKGGTVLGAENQVCEGTVLGQWPQHVRAGSHVGDLRIGRGNVIRENVTMHRALHVDQVTVVGDDNMFMVGAHVAHDCVIGNRTIMANNVMLAGHVTVEDRAYLSGSAGIHQFCRVGTLALVGGQSHIASDVPPFVTVDGDAAAVVGINSVGLRRAGYSTEDMRQIKAAYRVIYRSGLSWAEILGTLRATFTSGPASLFADFLATCKRGIVRERRRITTSLKLADFRESEEDSQRRMAG